MIATALTTAKHIIAIGDEVLELVMMITCDGKKASTNLKGFHVAWVGISGFSVEPGPSAARAKERKRGIELSITFPFLYIMG